MSTLSKNLIFFREKTGLSQLALAKKAGLSKSSISRWEADESNPSVDAIIKLCKALSITPDSLLLTKADSIKLNSTNKDLLKRIRKIEKLGTKEQKALFSMIDAYLKSNS